MKALVSLGHSKYKYIYLVTAIILFYFSLLKNWYPFLSFTMDSYNYIETAQKKLGSNFWPVGYGWIIYLIGLISHSDKFIAFVQFTIYNISALYFFYTILKINIWPIWVKNSIFLFLFINPVFLFLSNILISDTFFISLSLVWFTQLIKLLNRPSLFLTLVNSITLILIFIIRYQALYYPIITIATYIFINIKWQIKVTGIMVILIFLISVIEFTKYQNRKLFGANTYSVFSGWQIANNALFTYSKIKKKRKIIIDKNLSGLHNIVNKYIDSLPDLSNNDAPLHTFYLWDFRSPLTRYVRMHLPKNANSNYYEFSKYSQLYSAYGKILIKNYPIEYIQKFILPNTLQYFIPPLENLYFYNGNQNYIENNGRNWFKYKTNFVYCHGPSNRLIIFESYPIIFLITSLNFIVLSAFFWLTGLHNKIKIGNDIKRTLFLINSFFVSHLMFSIIASPVVLRYQLFLFILEFSFSIILLSIIIQSIPQENKSTILKNNA